MNLFFDLDGTLTDPGVGITLCMQHALRELGCEPGEARDLVQFIGLPLRGSFGEILSTDDHELISRAVGLYRERFVELGMFENEVYPGVPAGLSKLSDEGHVLWVVTSKPHEYARQILDHFGLSMWFKDIFGSELNGENDSKRNLVRMALTKESLSPSETWMIGDRAVDMEGGRLNGTRTAGVLWGYGSEKEIRSENPDLVIGLPIELSATEALFS